MVADDEALPGVWAGFPGEWFVAVVFGWLCAALTIIAVPPDVQQRFALGLFGLVLIGTGALPFMWRAKYIEKREAARTLSGLRSENRKLHLASANAISAMQARADAMSRLDLIRAIRSECHKIDALATPIKQAIQSGDHEAKMTAWVTAIADVRLRIGYDVLILLGVCRSEYGIAKPDIELLILKGTWDVDDLDRMWSLLTSVLTELERYGQ